MLKYKENTGCNGNLMPLNMIKVLFPKTSSGRIGTVKMKNIKLQTITNSFQLSVCGLKITHKDKQN